MSESSGNLGCVLVSVDGSEESMNALRWAFHNLKLRSPTPDSTDAPSFIIFHVQSPPSIAAGLNPGPIPFGGPSDLEVPAITAAIEAHQKRITDAILHHALGIASQLNFHSKVKTHVVVGDPKEKICEAVQDFHADVLVMGSRAFGPIKRLFNLGFERMSAMVNFGTRSEGSVVLTFVNQSNYRGEQVGCHISVADAHPCLPK